MDFEIGNNDSDNMDSTGESRYFGNDAVGFFFRNSLKHHTDLTNANVRDLNSLEGRFSIRNSCSNSKIGIEGIALRNS